jgi:anti-sigma factor RsiW
MRIVRRNEPREEELAALADGSLPPERRAAVEALVARSPELAARLEEQKHAAAAIRGAGATVEAPAGLRARIESQRRPRAAPAPRRGFAWAGGLAVAAAAAALVLVLVLPANVPGGPTVAEAAVLATRPATAPAPQASSETILARAVDGVPYPNWARTFGWNASGVRVDTLEGRRATTVFYEKDGRRIAYTIVEGSALKEPEGVPQVRRAGTELRLFNVDGRRAVTWERRGRTCILSGAGVDNATLAKLAAWNGRGTVPF